MGTIGWIPSAQMGGKCWRGWKTTCQRKESSWQEPFGLNKAFAGRWQSPSGHCKTWGLSSGLGTSVWFMWDGFCSSILLPVLSEHTDLASWKTGTSKLHFVCLVLPGLRAVNVLCSGCGGLTALHGGLSGWILLRRRKKDGIGGEFGCQLRGGAAAAALGWEGSSLGNVCWGKGNWVLTCLEVSAPRKSPNHSWLRVHFSTRMTFSCFSLI